MFGRIIRKARALVERPASQTYDDEKLTRFRIEREALGGKAHPEHLSLLRSVLPRPDCEVVDFGGGAGEMARAVAAHGARVTVVENPTMVRMGRRSPGVDFSTEIPACDVFFSSCALFYVPAPFDILRAGFQAARHAVLLVRNDFSDEPVRRVQISTLHDNGNGPIPPGYDNVLVSYVHQTLRKADFIATARECGFSLTKDMADDLVFSRVR